MIFLQPSSTTLPSNPATASGTAEIGRLTVSCPDKPGIVAQLTQLLGEHGANIVSLDQFTTGAKEGTLYQRTVFHLPGFAAKRETLEADIQAKLAEPLGMEWKLTDTSKRKRVAIFASKTDHCLLDLLGGTGAGKSPWTSSWSSPTIPTWPIRSAPSTSLTSMSPLRETRKTLRRRHLELLNGNVDLVVLARYMQIISADFLAKVQVPVINIHHSFLPAFIGAGPYQKAKDRGVKLIGATAHYVTENLDEGPIIEQDVIRAPTVNPPRNSCAPAPTSNEACSPGPSPGTARTKSCATAIQRSSSDMAAHIIDGQALAARLRERLRTDVEQFKQSIGRPIGLATVLVGDDPASEVYVGSKRRLSQQAGIEDHHRRLPKTLARNM